MSRYTIYVVMIGLIALFAYLWQGAMGEKRRAQANFEILTSERDDYRVRDSLSALSVGVMELKLDELRRLRESDASLIRDLGLRLSRLQSVARISTVSNYEFKLSGDRSWSLSDQFIDFNAVKDSSGLAVELHIRDTIIQVLHRVPRFKFLGIWFGTKGVRQEIVSKNPHTQIMAAEFLKIVR